MPLQAKHRFKLTGFPVLFRPAIACQHVPQSLLASSSPHLTKVVVHFSSCQHKGWREVEPTNVMGQISNGGGTASGVGISFLFSVRAYCPLPSCPAASSTGVRLLMGGKSSCESSQVHLHVPAIVSRTGAGGALYGESTMQGFRRREHFSPWRLHLITHEARRCRKNRVVQARCIRSAAQHTCGYYTHS